ncbi:DUF7096 domain-containing protein [Haloarcula marina]|uniref:DUF7096 domain-containing protein n=1 Tax=Haloarcula marina TaxID=2961574 RepID=UPI0020B878C9|nr:hypothetical protein [Halomicroarcula marina]
MRLLPALLVTLLLVSVTAAPVAGWDAPAQSTTDDGASPRITAIDNTTNHLAIPASSLRASEFNESGLDVGTAVAASSGELHQRHETAAFETRFRRLDSSFERTELIRETLSAVEQRQAALDRRQQRAISRYAAGEITAAEFLRVRAVVDAESRQLTTTTERVFELQQIEPDYSMSSGLETRLRNAQGSLRKLQGPVGQQIRTSVSGSGDPVVVYLEVSDTAYMLATIREDDGEYVRETLLGDERAPNRTDQFAAAADGDPDVDRLDVADNRASNLYTWVYDRQRPSFYSYGTSGIYELTATHPNGRLVSFLDGGTTNVFYELQHRRLATVRTTETISRVNGTLRLDVQRAYETGPLLITASNNATGAPVDGTVSVNGRAVGQTATDGALWTVEPRDSYTVTVTRDDGSRVSVFVPSY